ncbi:MAG: hypothetical protein JWM40_1116 [Frankiales bacterium]|nr:hypothetical protein [Frankiales bacterium]
MIDDVTAALARAHREDLHREADQARLARIATCCQPSAVLAAGTRLLSRLRGDAAQECSA